MKTLTLTLGIIIGILIGGLLHFLTLKPATHKPVDLPEEIDLARPGDKLIVDSIGKDSTIYISYHNLGNIYPQK